MNWTAWNSFLARDESMNPSPWFPMPNIRTISSTMTGLPTICMSNSRIAAVMITSDCARPTRPNASE